MQFRVEWRDQGGSFYWISIWNTQLAVALKPLWNCSCIYLFMFVGRPSKGIIQQKAVTCICNGTALILLDILGNLLAVFLNLIVLQTISFALKLHWNCWGYCYYLVWFLPSPPFFYERFSYEQLRNTFLSEWFIDSCALKLFWNHLISSSSSSSCSV